MTVKHNTFLYERRSSLIYVHRPLIMSAILFLFAKEDPCPKFEHYCTGVPLGPLWFYFKRRIISEQRLGEIIWDLKIILQCQLAKPPASSSSSSLSGSFLVSITFCFSLLTCPSFYFNLYWRWHQNYVIIVRPWWAPRFFPSSSV